MLFFFFLHGEPVVKYLSTQQVLVLETQIRCSVLSSLFLTIPLSCHLFLPCFFYMSLSLHPFVSLSPHLLLLRGPYFLLMSAFLHMARKIEAMNDHRFSDPQSKAPSNSILQNTYWDLEQLVMGHMSILGEFL